MSLYNCAEKEESLYVPGWKQWMSSTDSYHFLLSFAFRLCFLKQQRVAEMSTLCNTESTGNSNPNKTITAYNNIRLDRTSRGGNYIYRRFNLLIIALLRSFLIIKSKYYCAKQYFNYTIVRHIYVKISRDKKKSIQLRSSSLSHFH